MTETALFQTGYDRSACDIGLVHVGYGAFHRAHQAVYLDDYMEATGDLGWGIAAVNLRASESTAFSAAAKAEDGYLLKAISPDGADSFRTVRAHMAFVDAAEDLEAALDLFTRPNVTATSMTVTESGYFFNDRWELNLEAPQIAAELAGGPPQTIYAFLTAALARRMETTAAPITVLCCDNIRGNGHVLEGALLAYIDAAGHSDLGAWVRQNATFPCSMVDRITPRSTDALQDEVHRLFPAHAIAPIHAEAFKQWVLEDKFAAAMPDLARVGVQVVGDVEPYEEAKIRILNGGHTGLTYFGALAGHKTFDQAIMDPELRPYYDRWERGEVLKGLGDAIPFDTSTYLDEVTRRFENPGIADQLERICMDGYSKMAIYIRPTLDACLEQGITPNAGYDCVASWVVYARRVDAGTTDTPYVDPFWGKLRPMLARGREAELASDPQIWGDLPEKFETFVPDLVAAIQRMEEKWQA
jgi:D-arabinitol 4-dehydrogenase